MRGGKLRDVHIIGMTKSFTAYWVTISVTLLVSSKRKTGTLEIKMADCKTRCENPVNWNSMIFVLIIQYVSVKFINLTFLIIKIK